MRYISLFSGIGGFDLGFDMAGMQCALQVEKDKNARFVLNKRWPNVPKLEDVKDVTAETAPTTDLICGGFPCQDLSVAGQRKGLAGSRSGLWFEYHRIIGEFKPRWVVIENVPGLLSSNKGQDFAVILRGLAEWGYYAAWRVLDAQYFGLAQRRRRVFIVASLGNGDAAKVLFESKGGAWDTPPSREAGSNFTAAITERTRGNGRQLETQPDLAYALDNPGNGGRTQSRLIAFGGNNTQGAVSVATSCSAHGSGRYDFESETFICHENKQGDVTAGPGGRGGNGSIFSTQTGVRRLTPLECERLQGFPDNWTAGQSDTQRYRQLGNAVAVPVA